MPKINYAGLPTEKINPRTRHIERVSIQKALALINKEDSLVPKAVYAQRKQIEKGVVPAGSGSLEPAVQ